MFRNLNRITRLWLVVAFLFWALVCSGITVFAIVGNRHQSHTFHAF